NFIGTVPCPTLPTANDDFYSTVENTQLNVAVPGVLGNDVSPTRAPLRPGVVTGPVHGQLNLNPDGSLSYTPANLFFGTDSFTYQVNDGKVNSNVATVTIRVEQPRPIANDDSYSTQKNVPLSITGFGVLANDVWPPGITPTASVVTGPTHGVLPFLDAFGSFTYTPNADFVGTDTFTYVAHAQF